MTHLFKLKKDGKCVGYEKHTLVDGKMEIHHSAKGGWICFADSSGEYLHGYIEHDEKVPFVCDDKNGDKIFMGDKVKSTPKKHGERTLTGRPPSKNSVLRKMHGRATVIFKDGGYYIKKKSKRGLKYPLNSLAVRFLKLELVKETE